MMNLEQQELWLGWNFNPYDAVNLQVGLLLEVIIMRSKTKVFLNLYFLSFLLSPQSLNNSNRQNNLTTT